MLDEWAQLNQLYLHASLERLLRLLRARAAVIQAQPYAAPEDRLDERLVMLRSRMAHAPALESLRAAFGLSDEESDLLLLCAGRDVDPEFEYLFAIVQGNPATPYPTWRLAVELWPDIARDALAPGSRLAQWGLVLCDAGPSPATRPLYVGERVLNMLNGVRAIDEQLLPYARRLDAPVAGAGHGLEVAVRFVADGLAQPLGAGVAVQVCGRDRASNRAVVAEAAARLGLRPLVIDPADVPSPIAEIDRLARLCRREIVLSDALIVLDCDSRDQPDHANNAARLAERIGAVVVMTADPVRSGIPFVRVDVPHPSTGEQHRLWSEQLASLQGGDALAPAVEAAVAHFKLGPAEIASASQTLRSQLAADPGIDAGEALWQACRSQARPGLDDLAQRIVPRSTWDDLVLPDLQMTTIREIAAHVRQRHTVYERWGVGARGGRGLGISAMFAGPSGTGKTMAAEVLAAELRLDLYHIDLSQIVSKYIGETEKNLRRIFDVAEQGGAILLFDEADALFGKRSEVKDSHDRHANIEVSYLLQRMESYRGLAILTTNMKQAMDNAFLRRLRFVVDFPFPEAVQRAEIWRRMYPATVPTEALDHRKLSRLDVPGGNIRTIALNAAFLAADEGAPVSMRHMLRATRSEYMKLEKHLTETEIKDWLA